MRPGLKVDHLRHVGQYIADKQPDVIVHLGDHGDMPSLNSYDERGAKSMEGRRYKKDIDAAKYGMDALIEPIARVPGYNPRMEFMMGNHENRIDRAIEHDPVKLEGLISTDDLCYRDYGWTVNPFLKTKTIGGIVFAHYLVSGVKGLPITSAAALLTKRHMSAIVGHQQGRQIAYGYRADGKQMTGIIAGSCYRHEEKFLGPQGNKHWRGFLFCHEVKDGEFSEMWLTLDYLKKRYSK